MTRLLLISLLFLSSGPAYAEWTKTGIGDDRMTHYFDPDTIRRKGNLVKMWQLYDFKTAQTAGTSFLSQKVQQEYDCAEERVRLLAITMFSGQMGSGRMVVSNSDGSKWKPVEPASVGQLLWKLACAKK